MLGIKPLNILGLLLIGYWMYFANAECNVTLNEDECVVEDCNDYTGFHINNNNGESTLVSIGSNNSCTVEKFVLKDMKAGVFFYYKNKDTNEFSVVESNDIINKLENDPDNTIVIICTDLHNCGIVDDGFVYDGKNYFDLWNDPEDEKIVPHKVTNIEEMDPRKCTPYELFKDTKDKKKVKFCLSPGKGVTFSDSSSNELVDIKDKYSNEIINYEVVYVSPNAIVSNVVYTGIMDGYSCKDSICDLDKCSITINSGTCEAKHCDDEYTNYHIIDNNDEETLVNVQDNDCIVEKLNLKNMKAGVYFYNKDSNSKEFTTVEASKIVEILERDPSNTIVIICDDNHICGVVDDGFVYDGKDYYDLWNDPEDPTIVAHKVIEIKELDPKDCIPYELFKDKSNSNKVKFCLASENSVEFSNANSNYLVEVRYEDDEKITNYEVVYVTSNAIVSNVIFSDIIDGYHCEQGICGATASKNESDEGISRFLINNTLLIFINILLFFILM
ncbi:hypothetical protein H8356DRAFT_948773 [Neocallimastix lanati (nom. inval.)]|jgi:hypothetical protein|nr:hypothetical protein H8356DRAFT_948773 [Neocallimastix sp. JGI-2020a]